jgi:hypothetical protein
MGAQDETAHLARVLDEFESRPNSAEVPTEWLLSHRHAQLLELDYVGLFGVAEEYDKRSPITAAERWELNETARTMTEMFQRFVLGECLETRYDDELYRLTNEALLRLIVTDSAGTVNRANRANKAKSFQELERLSREGLVPASQYVGPHGYLDRLRKLDRERASRSLGRELATELVLLVEHRVRRWLAALAKLPQGALTEFPYLYGRSAETLERVFVGVTDEEFRHSVEELDEPE